MFSFSLDLIQQWILSRGEREKRVDSNEWI